MKRFLLLAIFVSFWFSGISQFPTGGFGGNLGNLGSSFGGFGSGGGGAASNFHAPENWIPDSVPLRITLFKEDKLGFYRKDTIDTTFYHFEILRPEEHFNDVWLGNVTAPYYPNDFDRRMSDQYDDFYFLNAFKDRLYFPSNNYYFRTNRPYTDFYYATSPKLTEQQAINIIHTQNVNYYTNFGLLFNSYTAIEPVTGDNSAVSSLVFWLATEKPRYRYNFVAFINSVRLIENGGIIDTSAYYNPESPQYFLTNGCRTKIGFRGFSFNPEYVLKLTADSAKITAQTYMLYARHTHNFTDPSPSYHYSYYGNYFLDSTKVFDSVSYDLSLLETNLKYIKKNFKAVAATGVELQSFYYFINYIFRQRGNRYTNLYLRAGAELKRNDTRLDIAAKYYFLGRKRNDVTVNARAMTQMSKFDYGFESNFRYRTPSFFMTIYSGNVDRWYNPAFVNEIVWQNRLFLKSKNKRFQVDLQVWLLDNYINFVNAIPYQYLSPAQVFMVKLQKDSRLWFMHFDNRVTLQYSPQNYIFNLPYVMTFSSFWFDFYLFKKALKVNAGIDVYWNSGFKTYQYRPSIMAFYYYQSSPVTGIYPIANIFVNFKVKRATIFVKFDYFNAYFDPLLYYSTAQHYHYPEFYLRYGVRWWFKN